VLVESGELGAIKAARLVSVELLEGLSSLLPQGEAVIIKGEGGEAVGLLPPINELAVLDSAIAVCAQGKG